MKQPSRSKQTRVSISSRCCSFPSTTPQANKAQVYDAAVQASASCKPPSFTSLQLPAHPREGEKKAPGCLKGTMSKPPTKVTSRQLQQRHDDPASTVSPQSQVMGTAGRRGAWKRGCELSTWNTRSVEIFVVTIVTVVTFLCYMISGGLEAPCHTLTAKRRGVRAVFLAANKGHRDISQTPADTARRQRISLFSAPYFPLAWVGPRLLGWHQKKLLCRSGSKVCLYATAVKVTIEHNGRDHQASQRTASSYEACAEHHPKLFSTFTFTLPAPSWHTKQAPAPRNSLAGAAGGSLEAGTAGSPREGGDGSEWVGRGH